MSSDPALGSYLPLGEDDDDLPGEGGIFNPINLSAYTYAANNPLKYIDPDGNTNKYYFVLHVNQPYPGSRKTAYADKDSFTVGHTWVEMKIIDGKTGKVTQSSSYGKWSLGGKHTLSKTVEGEIRQGDNKYKNSNTVSQDFEISESLFNEILGDIKNDLKLSKDGKVTYNLKNDNCTTWALEKGKKIKDLNKIKSPNNTPWDTSDAKKYKHYGFIKKEVEALKGTKAPNPADLGENIKEYQKKTNK